MREGPVVQTGSGAVRGFWRGPEPLNLSANPAELVATGGLAEASAGTGPYAAFLGIPYAAAPVGPRRFGVPERPEPWSGIRPALQYGPTPVRATAADSLVPEPAIPGEDILNLNVFTPDPDPAARLPVLVYVHGGSYTAGSPASPWYDGRTFNRDSVVTVSVSYRLGFDGFGAIVGAPGNRGVRDWLAALTWVQENIAAFGGDPDRVTIGGQSAGGGAVLTLLGLPAAQPLFHRAWSISGALADVSAKRAEQVAATLARKLGVAPTRSGFAQVSPEQLLAAQDSYVAQATREVPLGIRQDPQRLLHLGPTIDGDLISQDTVGAISAGVGADKELFLGATTEEFAMTAAGFPAVLDRTNPALALAVLGCRKEVRTRYLNAVRAERATTREVIAGYVTDSVFRAPASQIAQVRTGPTWLYSFGWAGAKPGRAIHCSDLPFWFDCLDQPYSTYLLGPGAPAELAQTMHSDAVRFVATGSLPWPRTGPDRTPARVYDRQVTLSDRAYESVAALVRPVGPT